MLCARLASAALFACLLATAVHAAPALVAPGVNIDPTNPDGNPSLAALQTLGAQWVRYVPKGCGCECVT